MVFKLSWGIAGAGKICNDFVVALKTLPEEKHTITAVASRSLSSAETFAKHFEIPQFYEGYDCLATNKDINVVYIGVINTEHYKVAKTMLQHGKNVLIEKPMCMTTKDTKDLIKIAQDNKCFLMEAIWSRCFPAYKEIRRLLNEKAIGDVLQISVNFGFNLTSVERVMSPHLGGGVIYDLGVYILQFVQFIFPGESPSEIRVIGERNKEGVDISAGILMKYPNGKSAILSTNSTVHMRNDAEIMGTTGFITVPKFWCPTEIQHLGESKSFPLPSTEFSLNFFNSTGLCYEADEVYHCINTGLLESRYVSWHESIELAEWRDVVLSQI